MNEMDIYYPENDYRSYLEHHGIPGQQWGVRRAAWYPIAAYKSSDGKGSLSGRVRKFMADHSAKRKAKKAQKQTEKLAKQQQKEEAEKKSFEEQKKDAIRKGTPGEIAKFYAHMTNAELKEAVERNQYLEKLKEQEARRVAEIKQAEFDRKWGKVVKAIKTAQTVGNSVETLVNSVEKVKKLSKLFDFGGDDNNNNSNGNGNGNDKPPKKPKSPKDPNQNGPKPDDNSSNEKPKQENFKQTVEGEPKSKQSSDRGNVVDGDYKDIFQPPARQSREVRNSPSAALADIFQPPAVRGTSSASSTGLSRALTPDNISTALTVVNTGMNSASIARRAARGMSQLNDSRIGQLLLEDKHR